MHRLKANFSPHECTERALLKDIKIVRFQENPTENWGPQRKAVGGQGKGKKHTTDIKDTKKEGGLVESSEQNHTVDEAMNTET